MVEKKKSLQKASKSARQLNKKVIFGTGLLLLLCVGLLTTNYVMKNYDIDFANGIVISGNTLKTPQGAIVNLNDKGMDITGFDYKAYQGEIFEVKFNVSNNLDKHAIKPKITYYIEGKNSYEESFGYLLPGENKEVKAYLEMPDTSKSNIKMEIVVTEEIYSNDGFIGAKEINYKIDVENMGETWSPNKVVPEMATTGLEDLLSNLPKLPEGQGALGNMLQGNNILYLGVGILLIFGILFAAIQSYKKNQNIRMRTDIDYQMSKTPTYRLDNWATQKMIAEDAQQKMIMMKALGEATDREAKGQGNSKMIVMLIIILALVVALFVFILPKFGVV